ncbi:hypothetical protein N9Y17_02815 [Gammaproteobacteria bacterium]|nr:hypothetical protein [Gammaproteobacteria bacterium]
MKISQNETKEGTKNERLEWKDLISREDFGEAKQLIESLYEKDEDGFKCLVVGEARKHLLKKAKTVNADFNDAHIDNLAQSEIGEKVLSGNIAFYLEEAAVFRMLMKSNDYAGLAYPGEAPLFWYLREFDKDTNFMFIQIKSHGGKRFGIDQARDPVRLKEVRVQYLKQKLIEKIKTNQVIIIKSNKLVDQLKAAQNADNIEQFLMTNNINIYKFINDAFNRRLDKSELDRDTFFKEKVQEQIKDQEIRIRQYDQESKSLEKVLKEVNIEQVLNNNHKTLYDQIIAKYKPSIDLKGKPLLLGISQSNLETTQTIDKIKSHKKILESLGTVSTGKKTIKTATVIELESKYLYRHVTLKCEDQQIFEETVNQMVLNHEQAKTGLDSNTPQGQGNSTTNKPSVLELQGCSTTGVNNSNKQDRKTSDVISDSTSATSKKLLFKTAQNFYNEKLSIFDSTSLKRSSSVKDVHEKNQMSNSGHGNQIYSL